MIIVLPATNSAIALRPVPPTGLVAQGGIIMTEKDFYRKKIKTISD